MAKDRSDEILRLSSRVSCTAVRIYNIIREVGHGELTADNALHQLVEDYHDLHILSNEIAALNGGRELKLVPFVGGKGELWSPAEKEAEDEIKEFERQERDRARLEERHRLESDIAKERESLDRELQAQVVRPDAIPRVARAELCAAGPEGLEFAPDATISTMTIAPAGTKRDDRGDPREHLIKPRFSKNEVAKSGERTAIL